MVSKKSGADSLAAPEQDSVFWPVAGKVVRKTPLINNMRVLIPNPAFSKYCQIVDHWGGAIDIKNNFIDKWLNV